MPIVSWNIWNAIAAFGDETLEQAVKSAIPDDSKSCGEEPKTNLSERARIKKRLGEAV
jgi:hypothetical protein